MRTPVRARRTILGLAALSLIAALPAEANEADPLSIAPPVPVARPTRDLFVPPKAAPTGLKLKAFSLFRKKAPSQPAPPPAAAPASEPLNLVPEAAAAEPAPAKPVAKKPVVRTAEVPLPRPRPNRAPVEVAVVPAEPDPVPAAEPSKATPSEPVSAEPAPPAAPAEAEIATASASFSSARDLVPDFMDTLKEPMSGPVEIALTEIVGSAPPVPADADQPYEMVRALQIYQDEIARGSTAALLEQRKLRTKIDQAFASADAAVWQDHRNAAAAVVYVLSGGAPQVLHGFAELDPPAAVDERLVLGALAYVEGREKEAAELLLAELDAMSLPPSMGAQVAIAQAALAVRNDPRKAMMYLDTARLLAPGTLVEEAALRREIFVADQLRDYDKFEMLSRAYLKRFRHSIYAGNFRDRFAAALSHLDFISDPDKLARVDDLLADLERDARIELYLTIAGASIIDAKTTAAALAADRALTLAEDGSSEAARAYLYRAAARVVTKEGFEAAEADLKLIHTTLLSPNDFALYEAVKEAARSIETATVVPADLPPEPPPAPAAAPEGGDGAPAPDAAEAPGEPPADGATADAAAGDQPEPAKPPAVIAKAETALAEVDKLLSAAP